jgi:tRNA (guanine37-N1)-methyltransferase
MIFEILTIFPMIFRSFMAESLLKKALDKGLVKMDIIDLRDFASDRHMTVDDRPYGGGPGMVMKPEPIALALDSRLSLPGPQPFIINLSPSGKLLTQSLAKELYARKRLILICGRYEGVDQRVLDHYGAFSLSVGDYVLNGGETPAMVLVECVSRLVPGFLGEAGSLEDESFSDGLLEHPLYTRPGVWRGMEVPKVLLSGNHKEIEDFRKSEALKKTLCERPELLEEKGPLEDKGKK